MTDVRVAQALELRGVTKRFADVLAVSDVNLSVAQGSVHALLGENGAGKTTLMRIAYGLVARDAGEMRLFGHAVGGHDVRRAKGLGVGMVHQHLSIAPSLTAVENLVLGGEGRYVAAAAERLFATVSLTSGLAVPPQALARDLSIVEQQRLEILKALARDARLLILDEPTAVLAPSETDELLRWMRGFAAGGGAVVLVTHKLREGLAAADDVTVLRRGRVVFRAAASATSASELAQVMFPARPASFAGTGPHDTIGTSVVTARNLRVDDERRIPRIRSATFDLRAGEIVGLAGIEGSGHRELLLALAGLSRARAGELRLPSRIAFIPADRAREGLVPELTLTENVALRGAGARRGLMRWSHIASRTQELLNTFDIAPRSPWATARSLSGGNQQRLVVARELEEHVDLLVADNPTRGLDLQATEFVHDRIRDAASHGAAVIVHSSDLDDVLALAARVLVVFHGVVRELPADRAAVGRAMLGAA